MLALLLIHFWVLHHVRLSCSAILAHHRVLSHCFIWCIVSWWHVACVDCCASRWLAIFVKIQVAEFAGWHIGAWSWSVVMEFSHIDLIVSSHSHSTWVDICRQDISYFVTVIAGVILTWPRHLISVLIVIDESLLRRRPSCCFWIFHYW
jgi:hypothetical protein